MVTTGTNQGEGLAASGLTISKNNRVVAIHGCAYVVACDGVVYRLVIRARKNLIEVEKRRGRCRIAVVLRQKLNRVGTRLCLPCSGGLRRAHADRDEDLVVFIGVFSGAEEILIDFAGEVSRLDSFPVYEHLFWVNSANIHLAAVILVCVIVCLSGCAWSLGS